MSKLAEAVAETFEEAEVCHKQEKEAADKMKGLRKLVKTYRESKLLSPEQEEKAISLFPPRGREASNKAA